MSKRPKKNKIAQLSLKIIRFFSFFILITPFIWNGRFFFPFVGPKSLFFMACAEIIFFSWLVLIFIDPKYRPKFNLILLALIIYLFVFILASIFGASPSNSFWSKFERMTGVLMHLHLFAFFLVLSSVFEKEDFKKLFSFSIFIAVLVGLSALINVKNTVMRGGGTIGNESFLGTYLIFNLFFALYLIFKTPSEGKNIFIFSFFLLFLTLLLIGVNFENLSFFQKIKAALFNEGARAAKISFYGGLILLFILWLLTSEKKRFRIFGAFLFLSLIILVLASTLSLLFQPEGMLRRILEKEVGSFGGRFPVWQKAWKGFLERPWLGWGPENFEFVFTRYYNPCMPTQKCGGEIWFDRAHNIIFDTLVSTGIFGFLSYLFIFFFSFFTLWRNFLKKKTDFWPAGIFSSLFVAYFVQNLTVFDMISSYMVFFLSLAFIASFEKREFSKEFKNPHPMALILIPVIFVFSFYYFVFLPLKSDATVILAVKSEPFSKERISLYKKVLSASPLGRFQIRQFFAENLIINLDEEKLEERAKEELEFLIEELEKNIKEVPLDYRSHLRLGQILNLYFPFNPQKIYEAEAILKRAREISPLNQQTMWTLAQNMLLQGKVAEATSLAQEALNLEKNLETSWSFLIRVLKIAGQLDLAREKFNEAIKINPHWESDLKKILEGS